MKEIPFFLGIGALLMILQTTSLAFLVPAGYKPDLFLILVFWAGMRVPFLPGIGVAFVTGLVVDLLSGSSTGLFAVIYSLIYVCAGYLNEVFRVDTHVGRSIGVFLATLASGMLVLLARTPAGSPGFGWASLCWFAVKSFITGLSALAVFPLVDRAWRGYTRLLGIR